MSFREDLRYEYDLTPDSTVIDCGFYEGTFTRNIWNRYHCNIIAYEPVRKLYLAGIETVQKLSPKISLYNYAVGGSPHKVVFSIKGDMTGMYADNPDLQTVEVVTLPPTPADLLKLNIEGMEYELLEYLLATGEHQRYQNIQVQFHHVIPDSGQRHRQIREGLLKTHRLTYDFPFCWENYAKL